MQLRRTNIASREASTGAVSSFSCTPSCPWGTCLLSLFLMTLLVASQLTHCFSSYQVRFGLLQAGHYGAPQDRVRFFLIASQRGYPLPLLPQPSHSSLEADSLQLVLSEEVTIKPILTAKGTAALKHVTISEAIGDLLQWDW